MITAAFFISPTGKIIYCGTNHITKILENPTLFNFTKKELEKIYQKYNEPFGLEGKAREEILKSLLQTGWIRIRKYSKFWSITLSILNKRKKDYLYQWSNEILKGIKTKETKVEIKEPDRYADIKISTNTKIIQTTIADIISDELYLNEAIEYYITIIGEKLK